MKRFLALILMLILNLSITGVVFAQDGGGGSTESGCVAADENLSADGVLISDRSGVLIGDRSGVLVGDRKGVLIGDRTGVLISDFYEWIFGESEDTNCSN